MAMHSTYTLNTRYIKKLLKIMSLQVLLLFTFFIWAISKTTALSTQDEVLKTLWPKYFSEKITKKHDSNTGDPLILTKFIQEGKLKEAREAARVDPDQMLGVSSYAGYFTVNEEHNGNLFFWYFPVENQPVEETSWIIWLQGGPGGSSLYGLFTEIGPFAFNGSKLEKRDCSWGKNHSLLFIDNPVGTGFSFIDDEKNFATNQTTIGENLYTALQQFLTVFPELRKAPLTIAGESYAGKHIPSLGIQIHWHKKEDPAINLTHLAIGNGFIDPITLQRYSYLVREIGIIDDFEADEIKEYEKKIVNFINEGDMLSAYDSTIEMLSKIKFFSGVNMSIYNFLKENPDQEDDYVRYVQRNDVRNAIHVGNTDYSGLNQKVHDSLKPDFMKSAKPWLEELIQNYKVMCYNGNLDIIVAYHLSVNTHLSLIFPGSEKLYNVDRIKWHHEKRVAGYAKTVGNFTELMVRGAGHMVPADQPAAALGMISTFIRDLGFDYDTSNLFKC